MLLFSACQFLSNGGTEIPNELTGNLYLQGGMPSAYTEVILYPVDYVPGDAGSMAKRRITRTDSTGRFRFKNIPAGWYNVFSRQGLQNSMDSVFAFSDSITLSSGTREMPPDTLRHPGSLSGIVQLRAQDDPRTATVQLLGTDYSGSVDSNGRFQIPRVAQGIYPVRVITTLPDYAPGIQQVTVQSGRNDTLPDILILSYPKHFTINNSTSALWTFDILSNTGTIQDVVNGFLLTPSKPMPYEATSFGFAVAMNGTGQYFAIENHLELTISATGKVTYEARIYLDQYPAGSFMEASSVISLNRDLNLQINSDGSLQIWTRKLDLTATAYDYIPVSAPGVIPLKRWVDVAVALDQGAHQCYGYVDEKPVSLSVGFVNADPFEVLKSRLFVGNDSLNSQQFIGKIDELRISTSLVLGAGLPLVIK